MSVDAENQIVSTTVQGVADAPQAQAADRVNTVKSIPVEEFGIGLARLLKDGIAASRGDGLPNAVKSGVNSVSATATATVQKAWQSVSGLLNKSSGSANQG